MERANRLHSAAPLASIALLDKLDQHWITRRRSALAAQAGSRGWWSQYAWNGSARVKEVLTGGDATMDRGRRT